MGWIYAKMFMLGGAFLLLFVVAELLYHLGKWQAEHTRKIVHIGTGLLTMFFPPLLGHPLPVGILCASFLFILLASFKLNILKSINAVERETLGSVLYPITVYGCFLLYYQFNAKSYFYLPILTMALCDPIAALVGKKTKWIPYKVFGHMKTVGGTLGFLVTSFILSTILLWHLPILHHVMLTITIGIAAAFAEAVSHKGFDNLTIPVAVVVVLLLFESFGISV